MAKSLAVVPLLFFIFAAGADTGSPYSGQQHRDIKALSPSDIDGYLGGSGMGLAKAAELNHYPGPRHVLDMAKKLELTGEQQKRTQGLFNAMQSKAIDLGRQIIDSERELDRLFAEGSIAADGLRESLQKIGALQAQLRYVHLSTHLEQKKILTQHQVMLYDRLRGYASATHDSHDHSHSH